MVAVPCRRRRRSASRRSTCRPPRQGVAGVKVAGIGDVAASPGPRPAGALYPAAGAAARRIRRNARRTAGAAGQPRRSPWSRPDRPDPAGAEARAQAGAVLRSAPHGALPDLPEPVLRTLFDCETEDDWRSRTLGCLELRYGDAEHCPEWTQHKDAILRAWVGDRPGTRPIDLVAARRAGGPARR